MVTRAVALPTPSATLNGYLALPDGDGPHPGVVVIHEGYCLNDHIRDITGTLNFSAQHVRASGAQA